MRCNEDVLTDAGFLRVRNSALFRNGAGVDVLSPGMDRNTTGTFWFDVRAVNLARIDDSARAWLLIRIVPASFALLPLREFLPLLTADAEREGSDATPVFSFVCDVDESAGIVRIESRTARAGAVSTPLLDRDRAVEGVHGIAAD